MCFVQIKCEQNMNLIEYVFPPTANECLAECKSLKACKWFSYETVKQICLLLSSCNPVDGDSINNYISGQNTCSPLQGQY